MLTVCAFFLKRQRDRVLGREGRICRGNPRQSLAGALFAVTAVLLHVIKAPRDPRIHLAQKLRQAVILLG